MRRISLYLRFLAVLIVLGISVCSVANTNVGQCLLKVVAVNDLARSGVVYIDGESKGTLESGQLTIFDLDTGTHTLVIDGETVERQEIQVVFEEPYESKQIDIEARIGKRLVRIITAPDESRIRIGDRWLAFRTPWQVTLEVKNSYEIELYKENYGKKTISLDIPTKGEIIVLNVEIPESDFPNKPVIIHPSNNSTDLDIGTILLKWESVDKNLLYRVDFDGKTYTTKDVSYAVTAIEKGKAYSWEVTAINEFGKETPSDNHLFTTKQNTPPEILLISPVNGSVGIQADSITLKWRGEDRDGDEISYRIYFGETSNPGYITTTKESEYKVSNKDWGKKYYWRIETSDNYRGATTSKVNSFSTQENSVPNIPFGPNPANNEASQPKALTLNWTCSDPDGDTVTYDVYFGTNSNPATRVANNQISRELKMSALTYGITYYWKVVAKDNKGAITEGPVWKFTIQDPPKPTLILVEKGSFTMGDTWGGGYSDEKPTHKVTLTYNFYIGKYEMTFDEYDAFCEDTGRRKPKDEGWGRGQRPVINVTWWDAIDYCNWLSEKEKLPKAYDSKGNLLDKDGRVTTDPSNVMGYRLPTEAEWEYAARGGNESEVYKYAGSDNADNVAWYSLNSGGKTQEVGEKTPNELGIYDMSGNVSEWCSDLYDSEYYAKSDSTNPYNGAVGSHRIIRGGSCYYTVKDVRVVYRGSTSTSSDILNLGFRICRTVPYETNRAPYEPHNPTPTNNSTARPTDIILSWDCTDPDGDTVTYDVYFGTNSNPATRVANNQISRELKMSALTYGITYYWKVVAKDNKGAITEGAVWSFSTYTNLKLYKPSSVVPPMVLVEKGSFTIGDTWGDESSKETPTYKVVFTYDFYIGKYETTFNEYDAFCEATGNRKPSDYGWGRGTRPVTNLIWWWAIAYCNWLSDRENLPKAYDNYGNLLDEYGRVTTDPSKVVGYRLPTEAEWEYAARGGNKSKGYKYSGSNNVGDVAWYDSNSGSKTQEVGKKAPNELGLYDMSGNLCEWCSDWYDSGYYSKSPTTNPYNSTAGSYRVIRGGSWYSSAAYSQVNYRDSGDILFAYDHLGFRIARTISYEESNKLPCEPYNPSPENEAISWATSVTLTWDRCDPDDRVMTYDVYFDTSSNPTAKISPEQAETSFRIDGLSYDTVYYWKVVSKDNKGAIAEGPVWKFTTQDPSNPILVFVKNGIFTMGDTGVDEDWDETPTHKVTFTYDFYMGKYEVTLDEYDAFCEATGKSKPGDNGWGRGQRPVINVTWWDAIDYCNWLSEKEKLSKAYDDKGNFLDKDGKVTTDPSKVIGYRLPTEAEWEYAARGGNKSKGYKYAGSDNVGDIAWYDSNSGGKTQEVGKKAPNELGLYDMSGNVWEWCSDWYGDHASSAQTNPYNSQASSVRVIRGGDCRNDVTASQVVFRDFLAPVFTYSRLGFRVCRTELNSSEVKAPCEPYNPKPENNSTKAVEKLSLRWDCSDGDNDNITYDVYIGTDNDLSLVSSSQSAKDFTIRALISDKTYYWKVIAKDSKGATTEGPVWEFKTKNRPPNKPSSPNPSNNATNQPLALTLSWECSDPDDDAVTYDVYFDTNTDPTTKISTKQSGNSINRSNLSYNTIYYWKVLAEDTYGATTEGPVWSFSIKEPPMVAVEKGIFMMGNTREDRYDWEDSAHKVTFTYDFYIGKYEVTFDEYDAFCEATVRSKPGDEGWGRGTRPVINVSWWDAVTYCNWLSEKEKLPKAYDDAGNLLTSDSSVTTDITKVVGYRLPTEAEWEYSARGGNKSKGYKYAGSDNVDEVAWYLDNSGDKTQEVGKKAPNELGIYDMSGNVLEWCSDGWGYYSKSSTANPYNSTDGSSRVARGGSWTCFDILIQLPYSIFRDLSVSFEALGFRIARTVTYEGENRPPLAPYNPIPSNEAVAGETSVTLTWDSYDPDDDAMTYDVYFDTNSNPTTKVASKQTDTRFRIVGLSYDTVYYWKVVAKDTHGATTEGPVWEFATRDLQPMQVLVEKGSFTMGDTWGGGDSDEGPTHKVTFTYNFYIGKYEITFEQYDWFCEVTGRNKPIDWRWGRGHRPVIKVNWWGAIAYCNWLSEKEKLPIAYDNNGNLLDKDGRVTTDPSKVVGYRLPTEAEWEYAARGGNRSKGYKYSGSDNVGDVAWYDSNSGGKTQEVGKRAPNELGIYDMSGNVWEWCSDWWDRSYYSKSSTTNPYNSTKYSSRVIRGGSWVNNAAGVRVARRGFDTLASANHYLGFRIARTVPYEGENRPPLAPYNPSPSDEEVAGSTSVTLTWDSYDPDNDAMAYDVYFDTNSNPTTKVATKQTDTRFRIVGLSYNTVYYWKVVAKETHGATTEGPVWKFSIQEPKLQMVIVEKGSFTMGDTWGDGHSDEKPTHKVTFTYNFYIGKYETTFDEYDAFCNATGRSKPRDNGWGRGQRPVINVSWDDAIAYCNWLSEKEGLPIAYDNNGNLLDKDGRITTDPSKVVGYRLPTEAEWEYAARGGNKSKGYKYSGSDNVDDVAWYSLNSGGKTQEVGTKDPNELGIYDMSGNLWEWCSDWYGGYSSSAQTNPYNNSGSTRVIRGGSWYSYATYVRVAYRNRHSPTDTHGVIGFRICRTVP